MDRADRWLIAWGVGYAAVGGASVLVPLYAIAFDASLAFVGLIGGAVAGAAGYLAAAFVFVGVGPFVTGR